MTTRPAPGDLGLLSLAILSVAMAAIFSRWADAPALALAFWRTLGGAVLLSPAAVRSSSRPSRSQWSLLVLAGMALAVHFGTWLESLERTSVATSVTLVTTAPLFVAGWMWARGRRSDPGTGGPLRTVHPVTWFALGLALAGTFVVSGGDALAANRGLDGSLLALTGAVGMAVYLVVGNGLRGELPTTSYVVPTYGFAACGLLAVALVTDTSLVGFDRQSWLAIGAMTLGPQLFGHTTLNALLPRLGSLTVSLALLTEPLASAALAWLLLSEVPPLSACLGAPLVLVGLALHLRYGAGPVLTSSAARRST